MGGIAHTFPAVFFVELAFLILIRIAKAAIHAASAAAAVD
jgi:hypothetical protein